MHSRLELQEVLEKILGSRNVYFQPPSSLVMKYPAIVYSRTDIKSEHANNRIYHSSVSYQITVIDKNPDSDIVFKIANMPTCKHMRSYVSDNLNHSVFELYY